jgi:hypothetical protein
LVHKVCRAIDRFIDSDVALKKLFDREREIVPFPASAAVA